jgi:hypothetical protein
MRAGSLACWTDSKESKPQLRSITGTARAKGGSLVLFEKSFRISRFGYNLFFLWSMRPLEPQWRTGVLKCIHWHPLLHNCSSFLKHPVARAPDDSRKEEWTPIYELWELIRLFYVKTTKRAFLISLRLYRHGLKAAHGKGHRAMLTCSKTQKLFTVQPFWALYIELADVLFMSRHKTSL